MRPVPAPYGEAILLSETGKETRGCRTSNCLETVTGIDFTSFQQCSDFVIGIEVWLSAWGLIGQSCTQGRL